MATKASLLTKRWNADNTISLLSRGKVVLSRVDSRSAEAFAEGWFGDKKPRWGRQQFRWSKEQNKQVSDLLKS